MNQDRFAQTGALPLPGSLVVRTCTVCTATFTDDPGGRAAHVIVFGHKPHVPPKPKAEDQ